MKSVYKFRFKFNNPFQARLELKERPDIGVYVKDLTMIPVHNVNDCEKVMGMGNKIAPLARPS